MDEIVKAAMAKWPNVPHCFDWLALDERGDWYMRDERSQRAGPFPLVKGSRITHDKLRAFIERNYQADAQGQWFFQNGPQRVYVTLAAAPWIWRLSAPAQPGQAPAINAHTGAATAPVQQALLDEAGRLYLQTPLGLGLVQSQDMHLAAEAVEAGLWRPQPVTAAELPRAHGFVRSPQAAKPTAAATLQKTSLPQPVPRP